MPLVVRDSIDYLQEHGIKSNQIYRAEPDKIKLQQLRKLYTDRATTFPYHWDVPVACGMLKAFISELPESILTQELHGQFEQTTAIAEPQRESAMRALVAHLPQHNYTLVAWLFKHFECVVANEQVNHASIQTIVTAMGPALGMSHNLISYLITKVDKLFPNTHLTKYVGPLLSLDSRFPTGIEEMRAELRKQESLLSQLHAQMHAGFSTPAADHQLWEAQRAVTQLKRKLRTVQKSVEPNSLPPQPSVEDKTEDEPFRRNSQPEPSTSQADTESTITTPQTDTFHDKFQDIESPLETPFEPTFEAEFEDNFDFKPSETKEVTDAHVAEPPKEKPKFTEEELKVLRLELENAEYLQLKSLLQAKINSEQFEIVKLRSHVALKNKQEAGQNCKDNKENNTPEEQELKQRLMKENAMLEQKRINLVNQIFQERVACIQLKIELAMKEILAK
ncbi:hypothetical protein ACJJTC_017273 [Scirpophaga incertulas]